MRANFQSLSYPTIFCLSVRRGRADCNVTSLQPTRSHERKSYEPKEKLSRDSPNAISRDHAHVDVYRVFQDRWHKQEIYHYKN